MPSPRLDAWNYAIRLLTAGDRSEHELCVRLEGRGESPTIITSTMERLRRAGYLDDARAADNAAQAAVRRGYGSERVRAQLAAKGISEAHITAVIETCFADEPRLAQLALSKRYPNPPGTPAERAKAARFLAQRGFPESIVLAMFGEGC